MRISFTSLDSELITQMDYLSTDHKEFPLAETEGYLMVFFTNGRVYQYKNVPYKVVQKVAHAEVRNSIGATFNLWVRNDYAYQEYENAYQEDEDEEFLVIKK